MLLALNSFRVASSGPTPSTNRTPIGLLLALTRRGAEVAPPATNRTPIGLLLALTRRGILVEPPIEPEPPPVEQAAGSYVGMASGASRGRMIRRRKRGELDLEAPPLAPSPPDLKPPAPGPTPPDLLPPQPGLMSGMPPIGRYELPANPPDEDEDEIALLLELLS